MAKKKREKAPQDGLSTAQKRSIANAVFTVVMFVVLGLVLYGVIFKGAQRPSAALTRQHDRAGETSGRNRSECPTRVGEPWEYDRGTQCFYNPAPGHLHWDLGKPPSNQERARLMAAAPTTPAAAPSSPPPGASNDE